MGVVWYNGRRKVWYNRRGLSGSCVELFRGWCLLFLLAGVCSGSHL